MTSDRDLIALAALSPDRSRDSWRMPKGIGISTLEALASRGLARKAGTGFQRTQAGTSALKAASARVAQLGQLGKIAAHDIEAIAAAPAPTPAHPAAGTTAGAN